MRTYTLRAGRVPKALSNLESLIAAAIDARASSYVPCSKFPVGAAVLTEEVTASRVNLFAGCNVENSIYVVTHAEQLALANAKLALRKRIPTVTVVVVALTAPKADQCALPCGFCRQLIREFGKPNTRIVGVKLNEKDEPWAIEVTSLGELLPHDFGPQNLVK